MAFCVGFVFRRVLKAEKTHIKRKEIKRYVK